MNGNALPGCRSAARLVSLRRTDLRSALQNCCRAAGELSVHSAVIVRTLSPAVARHHTRVFLSGRRDPSSAVPPPSPQDASARGELFLGSEADGYGVTAGPGAPVQGHHTWPFVITVVTPDRMYLFACETQEEQRDWLAAFHRAVRRPMLPQEYAVEARFKHKS
ncbi:hypothetical protein CRUP_003462 [Coryphaenoides rupestris]|nr:hypothetical protein CRUP_003462 [Coryphaenoides rupestris]